MGLNVQIVIDCRDPDSLAGFWAAALGFEKQWSWDEATTDDMLEGPRGCHAMAAMDGPVPLRQRRRPPTAGQNCRTSASNTM